MGTIASQFALAYRDFITSGVPASGAHEPAKSEIRALGQTIETSLGAIALGSVSVSKATRAQLNGSLAFAVDSVGLVYADPVNANNDLYVKLGASGSGSWVLTTILRDAVGALALQEVQPLVAAAETARDVAAAAATAGAASATAGAASAATATAGATTATAAATAGAASATAGAASATAGAASAATATAAATAGAASATAGAASATAGAASAATATAAAASISLAGMLPQAVSLPAAASVLGGDILTITRNGVGRSLTAVEFAVFVAELPPVGSLLTQFGITANFASPRPVGQYANGDWWVLGPVTVASITPASALHDGTVFGGAPYTGRKVHGAVINPGNRVHAVGGLTTNNRDNTTQGFDSLVNDPQGVAALYGNVMNIDPGNTGSPLTVAQGSLVKFVSSLTGLLLNNRPLGLDIAVFTVVTSSPLAGAIRPGISRTSKVSTINVSDFNLAVFNNFAPTANAPTYAQALDWVDRPIEASLPNSITNVSAKAINNHPEYGREIGNNLHRTLLALHLNFTPTQKRTLLSHLAALADDLISRAEEGGVTNDDGGGNQWKKPVIAVVAAALGAAAPASWLAYLNRAVHDVWGEDLQIFRVTGLDIATARRTVDGRPRSPYTYQMLGSAEWGARATAFPEHSGSNWIAWYRATVFGQLLGGTLAVELTTGAKALWVHEKFWTYMETAWHRRSEIFPGNGVLAFTEEMLVAHRVPKTNVPAVVDSGVQNANLYVRFDTALNETAAAPAIADFVVNVNGSPVTITSVSVWRQNLGMVLAAPVSGNATITMNYTGGANRLRSVDNVNVANFAAQAITNRTDKIGGPNAALPVVRFGTGVVRTLGGTERFAAADSQVGTIALMKFKFAALPAATSRIFGRQTGNCALSINITPSGLLELTIRNGANAIISRPTTTVALLPNAEYDILWSLDNTQATATAGANCYINGTLRTITNFNFVSGGTIGWNTSTTGVPRFNDTDNMVFELGALWIDTTARLDLTVAANRNKFTDVTAGNLDILTLGNGITGSSPAQFVVGNADQWNDGGGINRGTGNKFFVTSGAVTPVSGGEWI